MRKISACADSQPDLQVGALLRDVVQAQRDAGDLFAQHSLNEVVDRVAEHARRHGHAYLLGTSSFGHMLAGAVISRSSDFRPWVPGLVTEVLLLDVVIAGTATFQQVARAARVGGACTVDALAIRTVGQLEPPNCGLRHLWVLEASVLGILAPLQT